MSAAHSSSKKTTALMLLKSAPPPPQSTAGSNETGFSNLRLLANFSHKALSTSCICRTFDFLDGVFERPSEERMRQTKRARCRILQKHHTSVRIADKTTRRPLACRTKRARLHASQHSGSMARKPENVHRGEGDLPEAVYKCHSRPL